MPAIVQSTNPDITPPSSAMASLFRYAELVEAQFKSKTCYDQLKIGDKVAVGHEVSVVIDPLGVALATEMNSEAKQKGLLVNQCIRNHFSVLLENGQKVDAFGERHAARTGFGWDIPLSKFIQEKSGNCATMAILFQLIAQECGKSCYLIEGTVTNKGDPAIYHAWNIVTTSQGAVLCDVALGQKGKFEGVTLLDGYPVLSVPELDTYEYCLL